MTSTQHNVQLTDVVQNCTPETIILPTIVTPVNSIKISYTEDVVKSSFLFLFSIFKSVGLVCLSVPHLRER